jgi:hypothetical protein
MGILRRIAVEIVWDGTNNRYSSVSWDESARRLNGLCDGKTMPMNLKYFLLDSQKKKTNRKATDFCNG